MKKISEMVEALKSNQKQIMADQAAYEETLANKEWFQLSRNGSCLGGWVVPGIATYTKAVKLAGLPTQEYLGGSGSTVSTQYPWAIYEFLKAFNSQK